MTIANFKVPRIEKPVKT